MFRGLFNNTVNEVNPDTLNASVLDSSARTPAETQHQNLKNKYTRLMQLLLFVASILSPEFLILNYFKYLFDKVTNNEVSSENSGVQTNDSMPSDAEIPFYQADLVADASELVKYPYLLSPKGNCFGLGMVWYAYTFLNRENEFFRDILEICEFNKSILPGAELTTRQKKLLQAITDTHKQQLGPLSIRLPTTNGLGIVKVYLKADRSCKTYIFNGENLDSNLKKCIDDIFTGAIKKPGELFHFTIRDYDQRIHCLEIIAFNNSNIGYFDTNCGRSWFNNASDAIDSLYQLILCNYRDFFTSHRSGGINIDTYRGGLLKLDKSSKSTLMYALINNKTYLSPFSNLDFKAAMTRFAHFRPAVVSLVPEEEKKSSSNRADQKQIVVSRGGFKNNL